MAFLCLVAHLLIFFQAFAYEAQQPVKLGDNATLQCRAPRDAVVTVLEWSKPDLNSDDYVFFYRNDRSYEKYQHSSFRGRVELREPSMKDGDVSIILKNVTINDAGTYKCRMIMSNTGSSERVFSELRSLSVTESDLVEEPSRDVGRLEKAFQVRGTENGESVAIGVGVFVGVLFIAVVVFVVFKRHKCSFLKEYVSAKQSDDQHT